jgi:hypothetical protein
LIGTISFEKICMESRYNYYKEELKIKESEMEKMHYTYKSLVNNYDKLIEKSNKND